MKVLGTICLTCVPHGREPRGMDPVEERCLEELAQAFRPGLRSAEVLDFGR